MKTFKRLFSIIVIALLIFLVIKMITIFRLNARTLEESLPSKFNLETKDSILIQNLFHKPFKVREVFMSKVRSPVSIVNIDSQYLIFYKLELEKDFSLKSNIKTLVGNPNSTNGISYRVINNNIFDLEYKSGKPDLASNIIIESASNPIAENFQFDSVVNFHFESESISITNKLNEPVDFLIRNNHRDFKKLFMPIDLKLLIRDNFLYIFIFTPNN